MKIKNLYLSTNLLIMVLSIENIRQLCDDMSQIPEVRFAAFIDYMGNIIHEKFKVGIEPLKDESERKKMFMEAALRIRTREEFDSNLGPVSYAAARRKKVITMTFPFEKYFLFVSAKTDSNIDALAEKILKMI